FQSTRYPWPGTELSKVPYDLVPLVPPREAEAALRERKKQQAVLDADVKKREAEKVAADRAAKDSPTPEAKQQADAANKAVQAARRARDQFAKTPLPFETAYAVAEGTRRVGDARVHQRGDPEKLGRAAPRRFLGVLGGRKLPAHVKGSGRL